MEALGKSIGICAMIYIGKASMDSFKDWFKFKNNESWYIL